MPVRQRVHDRGEGGGHHQLTQEPVVGQPAQALGHVVAHRRRRLAHRAELAHHRQGQQRGQEVGGAVDPQRHRDRHGEQPRTDRCAEEDVAHALGGREQAVAPLELTPGHDSGKHRPGGAVVDGLGTPEQERDGVQDRQRGVAGDHGDGEYADHHAAERVGAGHRRTTVHPVHQRARRKGEQQPGQERERAEDRDRHRVAGQRRGEQRQGGLEDPVGEVRGAARGEQPPERRAQPDRCLGLRGHGWASCSVGITL